MKLDYDVVFPKGRTKQMNMTLRMLEDFSKSGQEVAEVVAFKDCYKNQASAYSGYRHALEKMDLRGKVAVITSGGRIFLVKLTGGKQ